jgi:hypothetical protein
MYIHDFIIRVQQQISVNAKNILPEPQYISFP